MKMSEWLKRQLAARETDLAGPVFLTREQVGQILADYERLDRLERLERAWMLLPARDKNLYQAEADRLMAEVVELPEPEPAGPRPAA